MLISDDPDVDFYELPVIDHSKHSIGECLKINQKNIHKIEQVNSVHKDVECMLWPTLFPHGRGGFSKTKGSLILPMANY